MPKGITKRKSESVLPTANTKKRKAAPLVITIDDSESSKLDEDVGDGLFVHDQEPEPAVNVKRVKNSKLKSRKSERVQARTWENEYEEDEGRLESLQFLALVEMESKKKKRAAKATVEFMGKFDNKIQSSEDALKKRLSDSKTAAGEQEKTFISTFREVYELSRPTPLPVSPQYGSANSDFFASLYNRSQKMIESALRIVEDFEESNEKTANIQISGLLNNNWKDEDERLMEILNTGHVVGLQRTRALLEGSTAPDVPEASVLDAAIMYGNTEVDYTNGWGKIVKKELKGYKKVLRALPPSTIYSA